MNSYTAGAKKLPPTEELSRLDAIPLIRYFSVGTHELYTASHR